MRDAHMHGKVWRNECFSMIKEHLRRLWGGGKLGHFWGIIDLSSSHSWDFHSFLLHQHPFIPSYCTNIPFLTVPHTSTFTNLVENYHSSPYIVATFELSLLLEMLFFPPKTPLYSLMCSLLLLHCWLWASKCWCSQGLKLSLPLYLTWVTQVSCL